MLRGIGWDRVSFAEKRVILSSLIDFQHNMQELFHNNIRLYSLGENTLVENCI